MKKKIVLSAVILSFTIASISGCAPFKKPSTENNTVTYATARVTENDNSVDFDFEDDSDTEVSFTETEEQTISETSVETEQSDSDDELNPEFKAAMDSYEEFYDEYIEFMRTYSQNGDVAGLLSDYFEYMEKANEMNEKMDAWNEEDMSDAEFKYYMEVQARITEKLLSIAQ